MARLLARFAENTFWMARYMERAENLARLLQVNETFSRDSLGTQNWASIVQLNADEDRFFKEHPKANAANVVRFYLSDAANPSSILSCVKSARDNARTLRPLISTEMWTHLNVFYRDLSVSAPDVTLTGLVRLCDRIKEGCQAHNGILEGTFYRDQGWYFYQLGKLLERADQTTRLLDIKYHLLLPSPYDVGSPLDVGQWNAVLRSAAGYHAFRRVHPRGMSPMAVAAFLLFDESFPRSVAGAIRHAEELLHGLRLRFGVRGGNKVLEKFDDLRGTMQADTIKDVLRLGLHQYLDWVQRQLIGLTNEINAAFFYYDVPKDDGDIPSQSHQAQDQFQTGQSQSQGQDGQSQSQSQF